jgi:hypothetical protein
MVSIVVIVVIGSISLRLSKVRAAGHSAKGA